MWESVGRYKKKEEGGRRKEEGGRRKEEEEGAMHVTRCDLVTE